MRGKKIFGFSSCVFGWMDEKVRGWKTLLLGWREKGRMKIVVYIN